VFLVNPDLARDLRRGALRGALLAVLPLITILSQPNPQRSLAGGLSLITLLLAAAIVTGIEGAARRSPENSRFWHYLGILFVSGLAPLALLLQSEYLFALFEGDTGDALTRVGEVLGRLFREPLSLILAVLFSGATPTLLSSARIRDEQNPTLASLKVAALLCSPLILAPIAYVALLVWVGAFSLIYSLADWVEGFLFRVRRSEGSGLLKDRLGRGELSRRDLHLAVILGDRDAIALSGEPREERRLEDMLDELQYGGAATLARATHALAGLAVPAAGDVEAARRAHDLAGQAIRHNDGALVTAELTRWPWHRDAPATQRAIHSLLEAAHSLSTGWGSTTCIRSAKECLAVALELTSPQGAREAVTAALLPWVLEEYDPLPQRPSSAPGAEGRATPATAGAPAQDAPAQDASEQEAPEQEAPEQAQEGPEPEDGSGVADVAASAPEPVGAAEPDSSEPKARDLT